MTLDEQVQKIHETIALNMRIFRAKTRMRQDVLASKCNISASSISQIEACKKTPSLRTLIAIARIMKRSPHSLLLEDATHV